MKRDVDDMTLQNLERTPGLLAWIVENGGDRHTGDTTEK